MPPKNRKVAKNAFSFYLVEYVENERRKGREVSLRIAAEECSPLWTDLPREEKIRYENLASKSKIQNKSDKVSKFTTHGVSLAEVERQQKEIEDELKRADDEIKVTVSNLDGDMLKSYVFYIIHCNYYCKTEGGVYVPAELAIAEFSLKSGIKRTYHTLINPGLIPLGYAFEAKKTIEEIHGLPYPPYEEGDSDYFGILNDILKFIQPGRLSNGRNPPLYSIENNVSACESILQALSENKAEDQSLFRVFCLHKMFFWLKNKCIEDLEGENLGFPVMANAESEISKDAFCYVPGISCSFHLACEEKYHNCSLSIVQRYVYVICDHCCQYVGVPLVPGKHCRLCTDVNRGKELLKRNSQEISEGKMFEDGFDGQSSYQGDDNVENQEDGATSLLHNSFKSNRHLTKPDSNSSKTNQKFSECGTKTVEKEEEEVEKNFSSDDELNEEKFVRLMSLGRGIYRR